MCLLVTARCTWIVAFIACRLPSLFLFPVCSSITILIAVLFNYLLLFCWYSCYHHLRHHYHHHHCFCSFRVKDSNRPDTFLTRSNQLNNLPCIKYVGLAISVSCSVYRNVNDEESLPLVSVSKARASRGRTYAKKLRFLRKKEQATQI